MVKKKKVEYYKTKDVTKLRILRTEGDVNMEAGTGAMWPQIQERWGSPQKLQEVRNGFSPRVPGKKGGAPGFSALQNSRE